LVTLTVRGVSFTYPSRKVLHDITLAGNGGEIIGLVGPNGSGKTTLIKCIDRIIPSTGTVLVDGKDTAAMDRRELARRMGYVPQGVAGRPAATVFDVVLMGRSPHIRFGVQDPDIRKVHEVLGLLGLEPFAFRDFFETSGGERQKVLIARALCQEPSVLLLDEPTSALDLRHQIGVMEVIRSLASDHGMAVIIAIHDLNLASRYCDRLVLLKDGRIHTEGPPPEVLDEGIIREVYGVESVVRRDAGYLYVIALRETGGRARA
jgi:iron complex transport system ATP-binding protein